MQILEALKGLMRATCFAGLVLALYSTTSGDEVIAGIMVGVGAYFGWWNIERN